MKKVQALATKLGCTKKLGYSMTYLTAIQQWLIEQHKIIIIVECMVAANGISFKYRTIDARTGFYNVKDTSDYLFATYKLALEAGVWNTLNYLR